MNKNKYLGIGGVNTQPIPESTNPYTKIIITRHGFSCNNLKQTTEHITNAYNSHYRMAELDPGLTLYSIITLLNKTSTTDIYKNYMHRDKTNQQQETQENPREDPPKEPQKEPQEKPQEKLQEEPCIFVSCLLRTWFTAILLYMPHLNEKDELNLIISPFIKEKTTHEVSKVFAGQALMTLPSFRAGKITKKREKKNVNNKMYNSLKKKNNKTSNLSKKKIGGSIKSKISSFSLFKSEPITLPTTESSTLSNPEPNTETSTLQYPEKEYDEELTQSSVDGGNLPTDIANQLHRVCFFFNVLDNILTNFNLKEYKKGKEELQDKNLQMVNNISERLKELQDKTINLVFPDRYGFDKIIIKLKTNKDNIKINIDSLFTDNMDIFTSYNLRDFYFFELKGLVYGTITLFDKSTGGERLVSDSTIMDALTKILKENGYKMDDNGYTTFEVKYKDKVQKIDDTLKKNEKQIIYQMSLINELQLSATSNKDLLEKVVILADKKEETKKRQEELKKLVLDIKSPDENEKLITTVTKTLEEDEKIITKNKNKDGKSLGSLETHKKLLKINKQRLSNFKELSKEHKKRTELLNEKEKLEQGKLRLTQNNELLMALLKKYREKIQTINENTKLKNIAIQLLKKYIEKKKKKRRRRKKKRRRRRERRRRRRERRRRRRKRRRRKRKTVT